MEHVSKTYSIGLARKRDLKSTMRQTFFQFGIQKEELHVLEDINLQVFEGDVLGIVGANGSGKTTLLKMLARVSAPTTGRILIRGSLSAMLEVRIGFHPDLTGLENIFLYGALMGMKRPHIKACLESIIDFSGLEKFMMTPVKRYSSGCARWLVRIHAQAVAIHLPADILILDEVLNFIDIEFQEKCVAMLNEFKAQGRTMIFVGHQFSMMESLCTRGIFVDKGHIATNGTIHEAINAYEAAYSHM